MKYADSFMVILPYHQNLFDNGWRGLWHGYKQLRIAETEKYAHVTFFFDGTVNYDGVKNPLGTSQRLTPCAFGLKSRTYDSLMPEMSSRHYDKERLKK